MNYRVEIMPRAKCEITASYDYIAQRAPQAAQRWVDGIFAAIHSLAIQPQRFGLAEEAGDFKYEIRQMLYGRKRNHRVIYSIKDDLVSVLAVRHAAQDALDANDC